MYVDERGDQLNRSLVKCHLSEIRIVVKPQVAQDRSTTTARTPRWKSWNFGFVLFGTAWDADPLKRRKLMLLAGSGSPVRSRFGF